MAKITLVEGRVCCSLFLSRKQEINVSSELRFELLIIPQMIKEKVKTPPHIYCYRDFGYAKSVRILTKCHVTRYFGPISVFFNISFLQKPMPCQMLQYLICNSYVSCIIYEI